MPKVLIPCKSMYAVAWKHYTKSSRSMVKLVKYDIEAEKQRILAEIAKLDLRGDK